MATWGSLKKNAAIPENRYGLGQGYFRYYKPDGTFEAIVAVGGKLIRDGGDLIIQGLETGFQAERMIESSQWKDKMYIATGTKLVEYDGTIAKVMEAYKPLPLEALEIGLNGLAVDPSNYMQDGVSDYLIVNGLVPSMQKGIANQPITFTTYISKPETAVIEYKFEYKVASRETLILGRDWNISKTWDFTPKEVEEYTIQVSARTQGTTEPVEIYQIPKYKVTSYDENVKVDTSQMHTCNRILLHWGRLVVYGDTKNERTIYITHLNNPRYFPVNNTLEFESNVQEPLHKLVRYRDHLVAFLPSSIQALHGIAPTGSNPYRRVVLHTGTGSIAPESAAVMGNYIAFLSKQGVQVLKSSGLSEEKMNVEKIDKTIENLIPLDKEACGIVYDNQYHLCFPTLNKRFRFYYEEGVWTRDESPFMDFSRMFEWGGELVGQSRNTGNTLLFDKAVYNDVGHVYEDRVVTKAFDFNEPHNPKKLKELQLVVGRLNEDVHLSAVVNVDDNPILNTIEGHTEIIDGSIRWIEEENPNVNIDSGTVFGEWELGLSDFDNAKQKKVKIPLSGKGFVSSVDIRHKEDSPNVLLSVGFIFKTKKP